MKAAALPVLERMRAASEADNAPAADEKPLPEWMKMEDPLYRAIAAIKPKA